MYNMKPGALNFKPIIVDTTLRDGEQGAGIAFTPIEKITIARLLDRTGIPLIEVGTPAMGEEEQEVIREIGRLGLEAAIFTWNRLVIADIEASLACGIKTVHISVPVSDIQIKYKLRKSRRWVLASLRDIMRFAVRSGCTVSIGLEDASRADQQFVKAVSVMAKEEGAVRIRYADTVGILEPFKTYVLMKELTASIGDDVEIHVHNDFGLAAANTLAAIRAGCRYMSTTVNGIGERAGNASLEEMLAVLKHHCGTMLLNDLNQVKLLSHFVSRACRRRPFNLPGNPGNFSEANYADVDII